MASERLKRCPFCGGAPVLRRLPIQEVVKSEHDFVKHIGTYWTVPTKSHEIACAECGMGKQVNFTEEIAIAAWNRRPDDGRVEVKRAED